MQKIISRGTLYKTLVLSVVTGLIIFYLFKTFVNINEFINIFKEASLISLLWVLLLGLSVPILSSIRWKSVINLTGNDISFKESFINILSAWPLSILPGRVGDFARSYPLRNKIRPITTAGAVMLEKIIDVALLLLLSAIGFILLGNLIYGLILLALSIAIMPTFASSRFLLKLLPHQLEEKIKPLFLYLKASRLNNKFFIISLIASWINWGVSILMIWFIFRSINVSISPIFISAYLPLAIFIGLIPISIGGIGTRDSALIAFFIDKATPTQSLAAGLGYFMVGYFMFVIIGIPFFIKNFFGSPSD